jgi:glycosyltransferase involved in cell wall biosynthesis
MTPRVTILLPTYNRARLLPEAIDSIARQTFTEWELVVIDDGSDDGTQELLAELLPCLPNPARAVYQPNAGFSAARNCGLRHASSEFVACFDSDDLWNPGFLQRSVAVLDSHPTVGWTFCDAVRTDLVGERVLQTSQYEERGVPHPIWGLRTERSGSVRILTDDGLLEVTMRSGFLCYMQASVVRRVILDRVPFADDCQLVGDEFIVLRAIARGVRFAFRPDQDVTLRTHDSSVSLAAEAVGLIGRDPLKAARVYNDEIDAWIRFSREPGLRRRQRALARRLAAEKCFWNLGYVTYWMQGDRALGLECFRRAIRMGPWLPAYWKTYLACGLASRLRRAGTPSPAPGRLGARA